MASRNDFSSMPSLVQCPPDEEDQEVSLKDTSPDAFQIVANKLCIQFPQLGEYGIKPREAAMFVKVVTGLLVVFLIWCWLRSLRGKKPKKAHRPSEYSAPTTPEKGGSARYKAV